MVQESNDIVNSSKRSCVVVCYLSKPSQKADWYNGYKCKEKSASNWVSIRNLVNTKVGGVCACDDYWSGVYVVDVTSNGGDSVGFGLLVSLALFFSSNF